MPRLTILIPCSGPAEQFEETLASVLQNRPRGAEVLVLQPGSYDDPYDLADEVEFVQSSAVDLIGLINDGLSLSEGEFVHVLQCGLQVEDGWADAAIEAFEDSDIAAVSPQWRRERQGRKLQAAGVAYGVGGRRRLVGNGTSVTRIHRMQVAGPTLAAGFYRREVLEALSGFDTLLGQNADLDLALALKEIGLRSEVAAESVVYGECACSPQSAFRSARCAERLFVRHKAEVGGWADTMLHPLTATWNIVFGGKVTQTPARVLGRLTAWLESQPAQRHARRREEAQEALADVISLPAEAHAEEDARRRAA